MTRRMGGNGREGSHTGRTEGCYHLRNYHFSPSRNFDLLPTTPAVHGPDVLLRDPKIIPIDHQRYDPIVYCTTP